MALDVGVDDILDGASRVVGDPLMLEVSGIRLGPALVLVKDIVIGNWLRLNGNC